MMEPSTMKKSKVETPKKKSCVNCDNCNSGCTELTVYKEVPICAREGCSQPACSNSDTGDADRYQSSDAPVSDPEATEKLRERIEAKLIASDPTNPLRAIIHTDGNGKKVLVWGALHKVSVKKGKKTEQKNGNVKGKHMQRLLECYDDEKTPDENGVLKSRFLHINTGTHGDEKGGTVQAKPMPSYIAMLPVRLQKTETERYFAGCELFMKCDIKRIYDRQRTSVFLLNSYCVPLYPDGKDTCDAWCMSKLLQPERMELYLEQKEIAQELRKD